MNRPESDLEREEKLGELFSEWLQEQERGSPPDRGEWLARHPEFADELSELIDEEERLSRLAAPLRETALAAIIATPLPGELGERNGPANAEEPLPGPFGDCELLEEIGRGGMAVVYRARQKGLGRFVALKLFRADLPGQGDADLQRFRHESEVVARLDHPLIVPIYEVGEQSGRVYFTMKLLEGGSLDAQLGRFQDEPRSAARLVADIARAVHHAHQRGILHRDLKPSNILLSVGQAFQPDVGTRDGGVRLESLTYEPHVSDFGLAKRLDSDPGLTHSGAVLGTPAYMPPEQASGSRAAVTVAADVYGLGAILYALLAGRPPFQAESVLQTLEQVKGSAPRPPSLDNPKAPADLETICLKCLRKEPNRRYESAAALADDLDRFLAGEPILARPVGRLERLWRWCRRQPVQASLAAALVVAVVVGVSLVVWQWRRAEKNLLDAERRRLEAVQSKSEADDSLRLAHEVVEDFTTRVEGSGQLEKHGLEPLRRELLSKAQGYFRTFLQRRGDDPTFRSELAVASARLADILRLTGASREALDEYRRALALYVELGRDHPEEPAIRAEHAKLHNHIALVLESIGQRDKARESLLRARAILLEVSRDHPRDFAVRAQLVRTIHNLALNGSSTAPLEETLALFNKVRAGAEKLLLEQPDAPEFLVMLAGVHNTTGMLLYRNGRITGGVKCFREASGIRRRLVERYPNRPGLQRELGESLCNAGESLADLGRLDESMKTYPEAIGLLETLARTSPYIGAYRLQLALAYGGVARTQMKLEDFQGALKSFELARQVLEPLVREYPAILDYRVRLERVWLGVAGVYSHTGDAEKSQHAYEQARDIEAGLVKKLPNDADCASRLAFTYHNIALMQAIQRRLDDARATLVRSVREQRRAVGLATDKEVYRRRLSVTWAKLAEIERDLGRPDRAYEVARERLELGSGNANELYSVAQDLAVTAAVAEEEPKLRRECINLAIKALRRAVRSGFRDSKKARTDPALSVLHDQEEFRKLWAEERR